MACGNAVWLLPVLVIAFTPPAAANTSVFTDARTCTTPSYCTALALYGVVAGTSNDTLNLNGGWTFNGGIAIGTTSNLDRGGASSSNTANDLVDFADAISINASSCGGARNICGNGTLSGTAPNTNSGAVTNAENALDNILAALGGAAFNTGNGTQTTLPTAGVQDITAGLGGGTLKVYRNTSAYTQTGALTLGCGGSACNSSMLMVVKITASLNLRYDLILNDGLTSDQVIFYNPSNNVTINPTVGAVNVKGDFFLGGGNATIANGSKAVTLFGRVYNDNGSITFGNNGGTQDDAGGFVPEPGTWAMLTGGFAGMIFLGAMEE